MLFKEGNGTEFIVQQHSVAGDLEQELFLNFSRIAVDQTTGNLIAYDGVNKSINSFNVLTGGSWLIAQNVDDVNELHAWPPRVLWTTPNQRGFFVAIAGEPNITHVRMLDVSRLVSHHYYYYSR